MIDWVDLTLELIVGVPLLAFATQALLRGDRAKLTPNRAKFLLFTGLILLTAAAAEVAEPRWGTRAWAVAAAPIALLVILAFRADRKASAEIRPGSR